MQAGPKVTYRNLLEQQRLLAKYGGISPDASDDFYPLDRRYYVEETMDEVKKEREAEAKRQEAANSAFRGFAARIRRGR